MNCTQKKEHNQAVYLLLINCVIMFFFLRTIHVDELKEMDEYLKTWKLLVEDVIIEDEDGGWHVEKRYFYPEPFPYFSNSEEN